MHTQPFGPVQPVIHFGGHNKHKHERFSPDSERIERQLLAAGINRDSLQRDWGVTLWTIRVKDGALRLKLHTSRALAAEEEQSLRRRFSDALTLPLKLELKFKPLSSCCGKGCKGCLNGNREKRRHWIG